MSRYSTTYPEDFDSLEHDDQYQTFIREREAEFIRDLDTDVVLRNINATFDMLDRAMAKRS